MAKNHMAEVAKMLGVELGEEFEVSGWKEKFKFDASGLYILYNDGREGIAGVTLYKLLDGTCQIVRRPWRPKLGQKYWTVFIHKGEPSGVQNETYIGEQTNIEHIIAGNCFPSIEAAFAAAPNVAQLYNDVRKMVEEE